MKKRQEEIIKTHVLNLDEIREAETKDKKQTAKKRIIITSTIGVILILSGILYPIITKNLITKEEPKKKVKQKNTLVCTANFENKDLNIKISVKKRYNFKDERLSNSLNEITFSTNSNDKTAIEALYQKYIGLYSENKTAGAIYKISYKEKNITITEVISDYKTLDLKTYDSTLNNDVKTLLFSSKYTYEDIKKQSEQLGSLCN